MWTLLLLAATVRSFAHMPLGISDRNSSISIKNRKNVIHSLFAYLSSALWLLHTWYWELFLWVLFVSLRRFGHLSRNIIKTRRDSIH